MSESKPILLNSIKCPDGTILTSRHVHDFVQHGSYFVDGGRDYLRRGYPADPPDYEELSQYYEEDDHEHNRKYFHWGTYGKEGNQPLRWVCLEDMSNDHIEACIRDFYRSGCTENPISIKLFREEILYRLEREIRINDG